MAYAVDGRPRYSAAERRAQEAERLAFLDARDRRWAAGTIDDMFTDMRELDCSTDAELRAFVETRHAELVARYRAG